VIDFIEYYKTQDHIFGECMSHNNSEFIYVYIPKNASSWTKPNLKSWGWEFYNYHTDNLYHKHALVVLRDPVERWLSGIAEYLYLKHRNLDIAHISNSFLNLVFDRVAFDDHTERQILFLQNLNFSNCTFFRCDHDYRKNFSAFLNDQSMPNEYSTCEFQHVTENDPIRSNFKHFFHNIVENNSKYLERLKRYFANDYKLIESTKFYAR
jgi:hypothetical protein